MKNFLVVGLASFLFTNLAYAGTIQGFLREVRSLNRSESLLKTKQRALSERLVTELIPRLFVKGAQIGTCYVEDSWFTYSEDKKTKETLNVRMVRKTDQALIYFTTFFDIYDNFSINEISQSEDLILSIRRLSTSFKFNLSSNTVNDAKFTGQILNARPDQYVLECK